MQNEFQSEAPQDSILQEEGQPGSLMATPMTDYTAAKHHPVNSVNSIQLTADTTM